MSGMWRLGLAGLAAAAGMVAAPSIGTVSVSPQTITAGVATLVTVTAPISDPNLIPSSVRLIQRDANGRFTAVLGAMVDDGTHGDATAGDRTYSLAVTLNIATAGTIQFQVTAAFRGSPLRTPSQGVNGTITGTSAPVTISIVAPTNLSFVNISPTTVTGTVGGGATTVAVNDLTVPVTNGQFSTPLPLREGPNIITASATVGGSVNSATVTATLDTTPPHLAITEPADGASTTDSTVTVTGIVNDIVVGTVNDQQAGVTVNGIAATVANRTFTAVAVPLNLGANTISVVGRDRVGNAATITITVNRVALAPQQIRLVSGNNQTGSINTQLASPLVAQLIGSNNQPVSNTPVVFRVTQNNGLVSTGASPVASLAVNTDSNGKAQVLWTLGGRAGAGGNSVEATSAGFSGTAVFSATGNQGGPSSIVVDTGDAQLGAVNTALPKSLIAVVVDAGHNRLANVPVTFTVVAGGGNIGGQPTYQVNSDSDGRVAATLTLGPNAGTANNIVQASFPGNPNGPASFTASSAVPGNASDTTITGVVLDNANAPIQGVTIRAVLSNLLTSNSGIISSLPSVQTNAQGQFTVTNAPVGFVKLLVDGSTAAQPGKTYPTLDYDLVTVSGQNNTVGLPIYLPALSNNTLCVTQTTGGGTLTMPEAPGFSLTFGPGQVTFPGGSKSGCISATLVHPDKMPMVPGFGQQPRFLVTIQPAGALFNPPAPISMPNVDGLPAHAVTEMYSFDHDIGSFVAIGTGTVSADALAIVSNPGVGVLKAGWHCGGDPAANGTVADCPDCKICQGGMCVTDPAKENTACPIGICIHGVCEPMEYDPDTPISDQPDALNPNSISIPLVQNNIKVSQGERVIFTEDLGDTDRKRRHGSGDPWTEFVGTGPYTITLVIQGSASWDAQGSGTKTKTFNSLSTDNVYLYTDTNWPQDSTIRVTSTARDLAPATVPAPDIGSTQDPNFLINWTLVKRTQCPTSMSTFQGATDTFRANPAVYGYLMGPPLPAPATSPYYQNETILESFGAVTAFSFTMADLTDAFKTAHPELTTPDMVAVFLWGGSGSNGTFVIDGSDHIFDQHSRPSFANNNTFTAAAFARGVGYVLPQTYSCGPNNVQSYSITTLYTNGVPTIKKSGP